VNYVQHVLFAIYFCCPVNFYVRVLYFSIHRYEYGIFWPHLRQSDYDYIGGPGKARGYNINVPFNKVSYCVAVSVLILVLSVMSPIKQGGHKP